MDLMIWRCIPTCVLLSSKDAAKNRQTGEYMRCRKCCGYRKVEEK